MTSSRWVDWTIAGVCLFLALITTALHAWSPVSRSLRRGERVTGLLIGSDYSDYARHSDTLMVVSYDPANRFLDVLSIPRDTKVSLPNRPHIRRINEVFAYEFRHSGRHFSIASLALASTVETLLSTGSAQPLRIPYYFVIDYGGFKAFIDAIGGVDVRVTEPMHYDDNWGKLHIHFEPGQYRLNGKQALEYVRFRGGSADHGRVRRQQIFVREVVKRMKSPVTLMRVPRYARLLWDGFHTNFTAWDAVVLAMEARRMEWRDLRLMSLPGAPSGHLWMMHPEKTRRIVAMMQSPALHGRSGRRGAVAESAAGWRGRPTVEVWNASNHPNGARAVMRHLRDRGFDVVRFGNFSTRQQQTLVVDRSGDLRPAQAVADALTGASAEVVSRPDQTMQVDVSVIIGNDYRAGGKKWGWGRHDR